MLLPTERIGSVKGGNTENNKFHWILKGMNVAVFSDQNKGIISALKTLPGSSFSISTVGLMEVPMTLLVTSYFVSSRVLLVQSELTISSRVISSDPAAPNFTVPGGECKRKVRFGLCDIINYVRHKLAHSFGATLDGAVFKRSRDKRVTTCRLRFIASRHLKHV